MYRLSHVTCVSLPLTADSVSFPDDLDYSFQHGLLNTTLIQSLDNTTSITLPPSQSLLYMCRSRLHPYTAQVSMLSFRMQGITTSRILR